MSIKCSDRLIIEGTTLVASDPDKCRRVVIPEGVTRIGIAAFMSCESLKDVVIPRTVEYIGENAFSECNIRSIKVPKTTHLEPYVFDDGVEVIRY